MSHGILASIAVWAETTTDAYPWRTSDFYRILLPSLYDDRGADRLLIAGPSEARENLLFETFDRDFPDLKAFQGAQSLGTFDDFLLSLEYAERVYGPDAAPTLLVLGVTPRFVGGIPRGKSPLVKVIRLYSPHLDVDTGSRPSRLVEKGIVRRVICRLQFLGRQKRRYRAGLITLALTLAGEPILRDRDPARPVYVMTPADVSRLRSERGLFGAAFEVMRVGISPYKYHHRRSIPAETVGSWMRNPASFWYTVHQWDPRDDADLIRLQFARLREYVDRHGIELFVVNMPEHPSNIEGYAPGRYESYLSLVAECVGKDRLLDLRTFLRPDEFYDAAHANYAGAVRISDRVSRFVREHR